MAINVATDDDNDWRMKFNASTVLRPHYTQSIPRGACGRQHTNNAFRAQLPPGGASSFAAFVSRVLWGLRALLISMYDAAYTWHLRKFDWKISNILFATFPGRHSDSIWCEGKYELICQFLARISGEADSRKEQPEESRSARVDSGRVVSYFTDPFYPALWRTVTDMWCASACVKLRVSWKG